MGIRLNGDWGLGSRAGLGINLIQYEFYMRSGTNKSAPPVPGNPNEPGFAAHRVLRIVIGLHTH